MKALVKFACIAVLACIAIPAVAQTTSPQIVYLRSQVGQPWGQTTNETAMDDVFGPGNWVTLYYETVDNSLLNSNTGFIFMEGGDSSFSAFQYYMQHNGNSLYNWIRNGGQLLIMAAPNDPLVGATVVLPGNILLNSDAFYGSAASSAQGLDPQNPIFNTPLTCGTEFNGDFFSHGYFTGGGGSVQALMQSNLNEVVLAKLLIGSGIMVFGGMTTDNFQLPQPQAHALLDNIITYASTYYTPPTQ